jgi:hypothetical protein
MVKFTTSKSLSKEKKSMRCQKTRERNKCMRTKNILDSSQSLIYLKLGENFKVKISLILSSMKRKNGSIGLNGLKKF